MGVSHGDTQARGSRPWSTLVRHGTAWRTGEVRRTQRSPPRRGLGRQVVDDGGEVHLPVSCLKPTLHGGLDPELRLGTARLFGEEVRIATEVVGWREGDGVDAILDGTKADRWGSRDALGERPDECGERASGQGAVDPAVLLSDVSVVVLGTEQDLEGPGPAHESGQVLRGAAAGYLTERRFELAEDSRLARRETHVA